MVNSKGEMVGVVSARSETDANTGYALTSD